MDALADDSQTVGGKVIGIISETLMARKLAHRRLMELRMMPSMHERKGSFTDPCDGFVTLPSGVGTMDELCEELSGAQLGYYAHPVRLLNSVGYYDGLIAFYHQLAAIGFVRQAHARTFVTAMHHGSRWIATLLKFAEAMPMVELAWNNPRWRCVGVIRPHARSSEVPFEVRALFRNAQDVLIRNSVAGGVNAFVGNGCSPTPGRVNL